MEYATILDQCEPICDDNYYRFVGWQEGNDCNDCIRDYFNYTTVNKISLEITPRF